MKALLMKDLHIFWRRMKIVLVMLAVFAVIPSVFQTTFAITYAAMVPYTICSVDEANKWDQLAAMMPYSPVELVVSKYVLGFLAIGLSLSLVAVSRPVVAFLGGEPTAWGLVLAAVCISVLAMDLTLPFVFRFGVEKARMTMLLLIGAVCGGAGVLTVLVEEGVHFGFSGGLLALPAAAVIATAVSIPLAMRCYEKREK